MISDATLLAFAEESNRIEGIDRQVDHELHAADIHELLCLDSLAIINVIEFARLRGGELRNRSGMNVRVGSHYPPAGGPYISAALSDIVISINEAHDPFQVHQTFESLHPFTDGNGRTGRALWLWQMVRQRGYGGNLLFLHAWYYQSLQGWRR